MMKKLDEQNKKKKKDCSTNEQKTASHYQTLKFIKHIAS